MLTMLAIGSFAFIPNLASADTTIQKLSVRMRGIITYWGTTPVFGWIVANARIADINGTHHEWAGVHAMWSYDKPRLNCTEPPKENVTFSFYTARLVESSMIKLNYSGYDFYVSGLWNVAKITTSIYVDEYGELIRVEHIFEPILTNATGELRVFSHWKVFELDIDGIDLLSGFVVMWRIAYTEIRIFDIAGPTGEPDDKINIFDIVRVAKAHKAVPGMPHYHVEMDFDFSFRIDIGDLTTVAASLE